MRPQRFRQLLQLLLAEARAQLADGLVALALVVVHRQQVGAKHAGALAAPKERANGHDVEGVATALKVVLFELEPVGGTLGGFVGVVHGLDDQALGADLNRLVEERLCRGNYVTQISIHPD